MLSNVIAIDGPAASGKSTIAQRIAESVGAYYVNTGNMYRAVALEAIKKGLGIPPDEERVAKILSHLELDYRVADGGDLLLVVNGKPADPAIRSPETAKCVSCVAAMPSVRAWLVEKQKKMEKLGLIVMEGRDIGTVVFPKAKYKFFLTASPEVRAKRRLAQGGETPDGATVACVAKEIALRDEMDSNRAIAPLRRADDAILIDSSDMSIQEVMDSIVGHMRRKDLSI